MPDELSRAAMSDINASYEIEYEKLRRDLASLRRSMEEVSETAYSEDGLVAATIGARGELTGLVLDPRIYRTTDAKALAASIVTTIKDASDAVTTRIIALTQPMLPEQMRGKDGSLDFDKMLRSVPGTQDSDQR